MAGARRAPRHLGPPKLPVLPQAGGDRRRPAGLRCLHCRRGLRGPGRAHPPPASRGTAAARRARAGGGAGTPAAALPRGAAALATGRAPATSRRWRRGWGSRPSPSAGSGRWHLQPRRSAPRSLSSLLHGSSLLPRPRRTMSRIPGRRQRRGASGSHGGARRGREGPATSHAPECIKETCRAASPTLRHRARLCRSPLSVSLCLSPSAAEQSETRRLWCDVRCSLLICVPRCRLQFFGAAAPLPPAERSPPPPERPRGRPAARSPAGAGSAGSQRGPAPGALRHSRPASQRAARRARGQRGREGRADGGREGWKESVGAAAPPQPPARGERGVRCGA